MSKSSTPEIAIKCTGSATLPLVYMNPLQGNLKVLTEAAYKKLKSEILRDGFSFPFAVWQDPTEDKFYILDGHQRFETLNRMKDEGIAMPQFPVIMVEADDLNHAKHKLLAAASQYGTFDRDGAAAFLAGVDFNADELLATLSIPDLSEIIASSSFDSETVIGERLNSSPLEPNKPSGITNGGGLDFKQVEMPDLKDNGQPAFKQMTFILHVDQAKDVERALKMARDDGAEDPKNENSNGNALAHIVDFFLANYEPS